MSLEFVASTLASLALPDELPLEELLDEEAPDELPAWPPLDELPEDPLDDPEPLDPDDTPPDDELVLPPEEPPLEDPAGLVGLTVVPGFAPASGDELLEQCTVRTAPARAAMGKACFIGSLQGTLFCTLLHMQPLAHFFIGDAHVATGVGTLRLNWSDGAQA